MVAWSPRRTEFGHPAAEAGPAEDDLRHHRSLQQEAEGEADHGDGRNERVAARVAAQHEALRQALGARRLDVVLLQFLHERRAHHAGDDRGGAVAERQGGQDEMPDRIAERASKLPLSRASTV